MKLEKKDIAKIFILIGIFIIALGLFFKFSTKEEIKKKKDWKYNETNTPEEQIEIPEEVIDEVVEDKPE